MRSCPFYSLTHSGTYSGLATRRLLLAAKPLSSKSLKVGWPRPGSAHDRSGEWFCTSAVGLASAMWIYRELGGHGEFVSDAVHRQEMARCVARISQFAAKLDDAWSRVRVVPWYR